MLRRFGPLAFLVVLLSLSLTVATATTYPTSAGLFSFHDGVAGWAPTQLHDVKEPQPQVKVEPFTHQNGFKAMRLTFAGGRWPCVATQSLPADVNFSTYSAITANVTVDRPTIAFFRVYQSKQNDKGEYAFWQRTMYLRPGFNRAVLNIRHGPGSAVLKPVNGAVREVVIGAYRPAEGQTLIVDSINLDISGPGPELIHSLSPYSQDGYSAWVAAEFERTKKIPTFKVAGTDLVVKDVRELGQKLAGSWEQPQPNSLEQVEEGFRERFAALQQEHPKAVMAILRDGEQGYDPADPGKAFQGWRDAYINSHDPDGPNSGRENNAGKRDSTEAFMRHRSALLRVDLSIIPKDAIILAAQLVIPRQLASDLKAPTKPHVWVVEPCAREWDEYSVNGYLAAKDTPWKAVNGIYYGPEPDFLPTFLAHGVGNVVNVLDFVEAVRFWQTNANHGFLLHGDSNDYMRMAMREAKDVKKRPAVFVVWEPKP